MAQRATTTNPCEIVMIGDYATFGYFGAANSAAALKTHGRVQWPRPEIKIVRARHSIRNLQSPIRNEEGHQITPGDQEQEEAIPGQQRQVFADAADHRTEQIGAEVTGL